MKEKKKKKETLPLVLAVLYNANCTITILINKKKRGRLPKANDRAIKTIVRNTLCSVLIFSSIYSM